MILACTLDTTIALLGVLCFVASAFMGGTAGRRLTQIRYLRPALAEKTAECERLTTELNRMKRPKAKAIPASPPTKHRGKRRSRR